MFNLLLVLILFSCSSNQTNTELIIFHAGSLSIPFQKIIDEFKKEYPEVAIKKEISGSIECARKITELKKDCDLIATSDFSVIDNLLIPNYAEWNLKFANNELVIAFNEKSHFQNEINSNNWFNILLQNKVKYGRSDENLDPCGYRTLMMFKLSEIYYNEKSLAEKLSEKNKENIRSKEVDLLPLLNAHEIDYIIIYKSVAEQHKLKFITLSDSINLKNPKLENYYKQVSIKIKKTIHDSTNIIGSPINYSLTIPKHSKHKSLAIKFISFLLDKNKGIRILQENNLNPISPAISKQYDILPNEIKKLSQKGL